MDTDPVHEVGALMIFEVTHIEVDTTESLPSSLLHEREPERIIALLQQQDSLVVTGREVDFSHLATAHLADDLTILSIDALNVNVDATESDL